jgi:anti-sigma factor RsiW
MPPEQGQSMNEKFEELLPWYVNGTLGEADRQWVEQHLASHPEAREELAWHQALQADVRQDVPAVATTVGLARTLHLIRGDRPTLAERVTGFFASLGMRPGLALAGVALMAVQGGVIHQMLQPGIDDTVPIRAVGPSPLVAGPLLQLHFAPGAREVDIRLALVAVQGDLAAGPSPQGDYLVRVPAGTEAASVEQLKGNRAVSRVALAAGLSARP